MAFDQMNIKDMLCDMYDIQRKVKQTIVKPLYNEITLYNAPKDNDGSCITMGDCIENVIEQLEQELANRGQEIS
jgi:hypothetical protein